MSKYDDAYEAIMDFIEAYDLRSDQSVLGVEYVRGLIDVARFVRDYGRRSGGGGRIQYWTGAERVGLGVMGRHYKYLVGISEIRAASVKATIRAFVCAVREFKG